MLSSNSGFKGLSQAVLSRSQFLKLAAGALLPLAGLRPSAAAPNGDTAGSKEAAAPARMGSATGTPSRALSASSNRAASFGPSFEVFKLTPAQRIAALVRRPRRRFKSMVSKRSGSRYPG